MSSLLPPKKDVALALLERASVFVHLDPRGDDVLVPAWFKRQAQLVLQVGLNMAVRIPDLDVSEDAIACTLSFTRSPHYCYVPWNAVYALVGEDGRGMVWPEDIPSEVAAQTQSLTQKRPQLRSVDGGRSESRKPSARRASVPGRPTDIAESRSPLGSISPRELRSDDLGSDQISFEEAVAESSARGNADSSSSGTHPEVDAEAAAQTHVAPVGPNDAKVRPSQRPTRGVQERGSSERPYLRLVKSP